jgi:hypothetical protein
VLRNDPDRTLRLHFVMIERVGFFDSPSLGGDRFQILAGALQEAPPVPDSARSLLVLPELFNLTESYYPFGKFRTTPPPSIALDESLNTLGRLAAAHRTIIVCSLLADGLNAAYYIPPDESPRCMCHKMNDDQSKNYEATNLPDANNPLERDGACIGALICLDALECSQELGSARQRREKLHLTMRTSLQPRRFPCVPAHMNSHCMPSFADITLVIASSGGLGSLVRLPDQTTPLTR